MDKNNPDLLLRVRKPDKQHLSFCDANPRDLARWIAALPKANIGETAKQLYQALVELNQVKLGTDIRLQLLELLCPETDFICRSLEKYFTNQPIVLGERARKVATLCQALQNNLAIGYKLVVTAEVGKPRPAILALALQRTAASLYQQLERAYLLYCPVPEGLWFELHQLYRIAAHFRVAQQSVPASAQEKSQTDVQRTYAAALLLGCARSNQLRQIDIARLAGTLPQWSHMLRLQPADAATSLFLIAPSQDGPPRYRSLFEPEALGGLVGLDTHPLVDAISHFLLLPEEQSSQARLPVPPGFSADLLQHLVAAWGDISERTFQRNGADGELTLCIGMSALHCQLAGGMSFHQTLKQERKPGPASFGHGGPKDVWSTAFDAHPIDWDEGMHLSDIQYRSTTEQNEQAEQDKNESYPTYQVRIVNQSPGGYCLSWPAEVPPQLQAGELVGIEDRARRTWGVALVRWIRQVRGGGPQMGVELIAPTAQPCGLKLLRKQEQDSQYLRALLLPAIPVISRPASLITARLPFQQGHKVMINQHGAEMRALLTRRQSSSGCMNQFEYHELGEVSDTQGKPVTAQQEQGGGGDEDFDSLWHTL
jgi:hypothetical protein